MDLEKLGKIYLRETRSISPENLTGEKGQGGKTPLAQGSAKEAARELGDGWKVNPYIDIPAGETLVLADIFGSGAINHIWMTLTGSWRYSILRIYWEGQEKPSVECPAGDFFLMGWQKYMQINALPVCVNPASGLNCYWNMPFANRCRITLENRDDAEVRIYYQIDYSLYTHREEIAYFHAQFRRVNPLPYKQVYTIVDQIRGKGQYVGTYMAWGVNNNRWWGEGEIKFYIDGDGRYPTICGTGTEDYFCGSYDFEDPQSHQNYVPFSSPYTGLQVIEPNRLYDSQFRFGMYRFHITDPIYFQNDLKVTIQALGWRSRRRYLPLQDDMASVAFWYQTLPQTDFPPLPDREYLEVN